MKKFNLTQNYSLNVYIFPIIEAEGDGSEIESTCCSCGELGFCSQYPSGSSQPSIMPDFNSRAPGTNLHGHCKLTCGIYAHM